jgi:hypothetical protein
MTTWHWIVFTENSVVVEDLKVVVPSDALSDGVVKLSYRVSSIKFNPNFLSTGLLYAKESYKALQHDMGQYVWINIPEIDQLAWHPFTIRYIVKWFLGIDQYEAPYQFPINALVQLLSMMLLFIILKWWETLRKMRVKNGHKLYIR